MSKIGLKIGFVIDPIETLHPEKDSTLVLMEAAKARGHTLFHLTPTDIWLEAGMTWGRLTAEDGIQHQEPLNELDILLIRKDPPFDLNYLYLTYLLEHAENNGLRVINRPSSIRDANEKLFTSWFPQCCPNTLVSAQKNRLLEFAKQEKDIVLKPLSRMGGDAVFHLSHQDHNLSVAIELLTEQEQTPIMAQRFIPEISNGDKRVILINGEPVDYALARIPASGDFRGNLAKGASYAGRDLTERDRWICEQVGPSLKARGLYLVGLDIIGDYLTEINVTSPTGLKHLNKLYDLDLGDQFWSAVLAN